MRGNADAATSAPPAFRTVRRERLESLKIT
jgi:hypothetical protein